MTKKIKLYTLFRQYIFKIYILRINIGFLGLLWIFILNETSVLVFAKLATFHYI